MTIPPATPDLPGVTVTHGVGVLVLSLRDRFGRTMGTVLHPDAADHLADELHDQAADARQAMTRIHPGNTRHPGAANTPPPATATPGHPGDTGTPPANPGGTAAGRVTPPSNLSANEVSPDASTQQQRHHHATRARVGAPAGASPAPPQGIRQALSVLRSTNAARPRPPPRPRGTPRPRWEDRPRPHRPRLLQRPRRWPPRCAATQRATSRQREQPCSTLVTGTRQGGRAPGGRGPGGS